MEPWPDSIWGYSKMKKKEMQRETQMQTSTREFQNPKVVQICHLQVSGHNLEHHQLGMKKKEKEEMGIWETICSNGDYCLPVAGEH
jgi:hypothetical protein